MRTITNEIFEQSSWDAQYRIMNACEGLLRPAQFRSAFSLHSDLSGNIFYQIGNELKPLGIQIPELADVAEMGGGG
jgi:hypothetical protein